jgi:two-component system sensor histidine kinase DegS
MANYKINIKKLDAIIKKTVEAIHMSKQEIFEISENARKECTTLEQELNELKAQVKEIIEVEEVLEEQLKESRIKLMIVSRNHHQYSQDEIQKAYEKADSLRIQLAVKREQEQYLVRRRNDLEVRIKDAYRTIQKADKLHSHIEVALNCLQGDLKDVALQIDDIQQKQLMGLRIIQAQEEERQRVARDIHDGPAQSMSNVVLKAEICERLFSVDLEKARDELQKLKDIVRDCLKDVRKIIYNLRPMSLDDLGLIPTLQRLILTFRNETGIEATFNKNGVFDDIRPGISLTIFRIVQEALSNVQKHSGAKNVAISLDFTDKEIKLHIYDDGKGFDSEAVKVNTEDTDAGFGLYSMNERVELLGGSFELTSMPGKGTRINVVIPFIQNGEDEHE